MGIATELIEIDTLGFFGPPYCTCSTPKISFYLLLNVPVIFNTLIKCLFVLKIILYMTKILPELIIEQSYVCYPFLNITFYLPDPF